VCFEVVELIQGVGYLGADYVATHQAREDFRLEMVRRQQLVLAGVAFRKGELYEAGTGLSSRGVPVAAQ
jgi:hypothetical protein